jgi:hypothetical protein
MKESHSFSFSLRSFGRFSSRPTELRVSWASELFSLSHSNDPNQKQLPSTPGSTDNSPHVDCEGRSNVSSVRMKVIMPQKRHSLAFRSEVKTQSWHALEGAYVMQRQVFVGQGRMTPADNHSTVNPNEPCRFDKIKANQRCSCSPELTCRRVSGHWMERIVAFDFSAEGAANNIQRFRHGANAASVSRVMRGA